jgi:hypothetical protein
VQQSSSTLFRDFVIASPEELNETESMAEWIGHECKLAPLMRGDGFLKSASNRNGVLNRGLNFLDDKIDFNIRLNAQGIPGVLLFPVSKLFEYASDGSLSKPVWRPKRLPAL